MTKEEAEKKIKALKKKAQETLWEAEVLADEHGIVFDFEITYGAGATYYPASEVDDWMKEDLGLADDEGAWISSSQMC